MSNPTAMAAQGQRRFVKVAAPTVHAGVGNALRMAYCLDNGRQSPDCFEKLLRDIDR